MEQECVSCEVKSLRQRVGEKAGGDTQLGRGVGEGTWGSVWILSLILEVTHTRSFQASLGTYLRQCGEGPWASVSLSGSRLSPCTSWGWREKFQVLPALPQAGSEGSLVGDCRPPWSLATLPTQTVWADALPVPTPPPRSPCSPSPQLCPHCFPQHRNRPTQSALKMPKLLQSQDLCTGLSLTWCTLSLVFKGSSCLTVFTNKHYLHETLPELHPASVWSHKITLYIFFLTFITMWSLLFTAAQPLVSCLFPQSLDFVCQFLDPHSTCTQR